MEGVTIAYFNESLIREAGFEPVLYDHDGKLIVIQRKAMKGCGPVIVDGAFTKLFYKWDGNYT